MMKLRVSCSIENHRRLRHLHHEAWIVSARQVIRGTDASKYTIDQGCREAAEADTQDPHLSQNCDQGRLAEIRALPCPYSAW